MTLWLDLDADCLDLGEEVERLEEALPPDARILHPAKRHVEIPDHPTVHPHRAALPQKKKQFTYIVPLCHRKKTTVHLHRAALPQKKNNSSPTLCHSATEKKQQFTHTVPLCHRKKQQFTHTVPLCHRKKPSSPTLCHSATEKKQFTHTVPLCHRKKTVHPHRPALLKNKNGRSRPRTGLRPYTV